MGELKLDLIDLIEVGKTDSISGRTLGEKYAKKVHLADHIKSGNNVEIVIPSLIKAINDSFWKGFFSDLFKVYKSKEKIKSYFTFTTDDYYKSVIDKNLTILDSIYNS